MKINLYLCLCVLLAGCGITGNLGSNYGQIYEVGKFLDCGDFSVRSFDRFLRSSPNRYGEGTYVGYLDYGPGMSRGAVFLVLEADPNDYSSLASLLKGSVPQKRSFWSEVQMLNGQIEPGSFFDAVVPEKAKEMGRSKIVNRSALYIRGTIIRRHGTDYLVMVQDNYPGRDQEGKTYMEQKLEQFMASIVWKTTN